MKKFILIAIILLTLGTSNIAHGAIPVAQESNYLVKVGNALVGKLATMDLGTSLRPFGALYAGALTISGITLSGAINAGDQNINNVGTLYVDADNNSGIGSWTDNTIDFISNGITYLKLNTNALTFQGSAPTITTITNKNLTLAPNGSGQTKIGDAGTCLSLATDNDDLCATDDVEVMDTLYTGGMTFADNRGDVPVWNYSVTNASASGTAQSYPILIDGQFIASFYSESDGAGGIQNKTVRVVALQSYGRNQEKQGTDVASATNTTLASDGNTFEITGTTKIDLISSVGWQEGSIVRLVCNESVTLDNGTATSGTNITMKLAGAGDFFCTADDVITLVLSSTTAGGQAWREVSRSVN